MPRWSLQGNFTFAGKCVHRSACTSHFLDKQRVSPTHEGMTGETNSSLENLHGGAASRLRLSVVICTRDRPDVLRDTLATVWTQSRRPDELAIIDDGRLEAESIAMAARDAGVSFVYHNKSDAPGLARSRSAGIRESSGDVLMFLDDDVLLEENYIEAVMDVFEADADRQIGGCTGVLTGFRYRRFQLGLLRLFGLDHPGREGQVLRNFVGVLVRNIDRKTDVQWLPGCNMSYRRQAIEEIEIPAYLENYSQGEDRAISYEVGRRWRLVATPDARLIHRKVQISRLPGRKWGFQEIYYNYMHWRRYMPRDLRHRAAYAWLCVGYVVVNLLRLDGRRVLGNLDGIVRILFGKDDDGAGHPHSRRADDV